MESQISDLRGEETAHACEIGLVSTTDRKWHTGRSKESAMLSHVDVEFIRAEIRAGLTFSHIALQAKSDEKRERNRVNARKAYNALLRFVDESALSANGVEGFANSLAELRSNLLQLGEKL